MPRAELSDLEWTAHATAARNAIRAWRRDHPEEKRPLGFTPFQAGGGGWIRVLRFPSLAGDKVAGYRVDLCGS